MGKMDFVIWDYEVMVGLLMGSMVGVVMNEMLRLILLVVEVFKVV